MGSRGGYLHHVDPARNMARFYVLQVQASLFGEWVLIREWGRIGSAGTVKATPYLTQTEAEDALTRLQRQKLRRGYTPLCEVRAECFFSLPTPPKPESIPLTLTRPTS